jgi:outer membrane protein assembly factor BamB
MAKPSKPKKITVAREGEILAGPLVSSDGIFVGAKDHVTVRLDRRSLKSVWSVESDKYRIGQLINDELMTVGGKPGGGVRSTADGRLLWSAPTRFFGVGVWQRCVLLHGSDLELRDPAMGDLIRGIKVTGGYDDPGTTSNDLWILSTGSSHVKAINLVSGELVWERALLSEMAPYVSEAERHNAVTITHGSLAGMFIVRYGDATFGCSLTDGSVVWHAPVAVPYYWPNVEAGCVYVLLFDRFIAIDEATGRILYDVKHPELGGAYRAKAGTLYKGRIAIPNESGHVAVFNVADGALVSLREDTLPLWRTAEADGRLFVTTGDGKLLVFDESIWGV